MVIFGDTKCQYVAGGSSRLWSNRTWLAWPCPLTSAGGPFSSMFQFSSSSALFPTYWADHSDAPRPHCMSPLDSGKLNFLEWDTEILKHSLHGFTFDHLWACAVPRSKSCSPSPASLWEYNLLLSEGFIEEPVEPLWANVDHRQLLIKWY